VIQAVSEPATGKSWWSIVNDRAPLPRAFGNGWTFGKLPLGGAPRWIKPAPADPNAKTPTVQLVSQTRTGSARTLVLRLTSNGSDDIELVAPEDAMIRSAGVQGFLRPIDPSGSGKYYIGCEGRACDGATLQFTTGQVKPIRFLIVGSRFALPGSAAPLLVAKPVFARPQYNPDARIVFASVNL
jgi:hypothetical protein